MYLRPEPDYGYVWQSWVYFLEIGMLAVLSGMFSLLCAWLLRLPRRGKAPQRWQILSMHLLSGLIVPVANRELIYPEVDRFIRDLNLFS